MDYRYGVFQWREDGIYPPELAARRALYIRESAAQRAADGLNVYGGNYVVRTVAVPKEN